MDYFFGLKSVLSHQAPEAQPSPLETVERLVDRVQSSSLTEDRRDACRALKSLSKKYRLHVGAQGLDTLTSVLIEQGDADTRGFVLETLCNVTSAEVLEGEEESNGKQFTEILLKKAENVGAVIDCLDEYSSNVRLPAIKLLMNLLINSPKEMQEIVLVSPMGVSKLMDILSDNREYVSNEALLLLTQLTKNNASIQKIVVFENGFDKIFQVIRGEGHSDGGIVVYDCLQLLLNLLKQNSSNQIFFREGSYIKNITPFLQTCVQEDLTSGWPVQKISNVHSMLQVVRTLVSPSNPAKDVGATQSAMATCGLLSELCTLLMAGGVPAEILSETICTVGEMMRGCQANQEAFAKVMAPSSPPRSALVVLLTSMVNEKQPVQLRTAVLYCLQCYLYKNEAGQLQVVHALLPTSTEARLTVTPGQLLCTGLFTAEPLSHWLSAVSLSHALVANTNAKELLLRVQLATAPDAPPVSLLQQSFFILERAPKIQTRLGILMLLSTWLAHCPNAVAQFVKLKDSVPFLMAQLGREHDEQEVIAQSMCAFLLGLCVVFNNDSNSSFNRESVSLLIMRRIGVEMFVDKLAEIAKHQVYSTGLKHPQINAGNSNEVQLDHEFCRLYKGLESTLAKALAPTPSNPKADEGPSQAELEAATVKMKQLVGEQEAQILHLRQRLAALEGQYISSQSVIEELNATVQQLQDENALLKAQRNNNVDIDEAAEEARQQQLQQLESQLEQLQIQLDSVIVDNKMLQTQLLDKDRQLESLSSHDTSNANSLSILDSFQLTGGQDLQVCSIFRPEPGVNGDRIAELECELSALTESNCELERRVACLNDRGAEQESELAALRLRTSEQESELVALQDRIDEQDCELTELRDRRSGVDAELVELRARNADQDVRLSSLLSRSSELESELTALKDRSDQPESAAPACELHELRAHKEQMLAEVDKARKDQEDLLILLADQDTKLLKYKDLLRNLGQDVSEEDDDDVDVGDDLDDDLDDLSA